MVRRCHNSTDPSYARYGGRGIVVCDRWRSNVAAFIADMGAPPSMDYSIDRIDNNGNYDPANCRWATRKQQDRNKSNTITVMYQGRPMAAHDFAEEMGLTKGTVHFWAKYRKLTGEQIIRRENARRSRLIAIKERKAAEARRDGAAPPECLNCVKYANGTGVQCRRHLWRTANLRPEATP